MKTILLLAAVLALTGCGTVERVVEVPVAVPVACKAEMPERPTMPTDTLELDAPVDRQARFMRAEIEMRDGYEGKLVAALESCRKLSTTERK